METTIKRAITGGWTDAGDWDFISRNTNFSERQAFLLDPLFWQALFSDEYKEIAVFFDGELGESQLQVEWLAHAMNFHKINLTESFEKAIAYLQEVTNPN